MNFSMLDGNFMLLMSNFFLHFGKILAGIKAFYLQQVTRFLEKKAVPKIVVFLLDSVDLSVILWM